MPRSRISIEFGTGPPQDLAPAWYRCEHHMLVRLLYSSFKDLTARVARLWVGLHLICARKGTDAEGQARHVPRWARI